MVLREELPPEEDGTDEEDAPDILLPDPGAGSGAGEERRSSTTVAVVADAPLVIVGGMVRGSESGTIGPLWVTADDSAGDGKTAAVTHPEQRDFSPAGHPHVEDCVEQRDEAGRTLQRVPLGSDVAFLHEAFE